MNTSLSNTSFFNNNNEKKRITYRLFDTAEETGRGRERGRKRRENERVGNGNGRIKNSTALRGYV